MDCTRLVREVGANIANIGIGGTAVAVGVAGLMEVVLPVIVTRWFGEGVCRKGGGGGRKGRLQGCREGGGGKFVGLVVC